MLARSGSADALVRKVSLRSLSSPTLYSELTTVNPMRLSLKLGGNPRLIASIVGAGYLGAHLNLADRAKEKHAVSNRPGNGGTNTRH